MNTGTSNSVFTFDAVWTDSDGNWPSVGWPTPTPPPDFTGVLTDAPGVVWLWGVGGALPNDADIPAIPMFYVRGDPQFGALYRTYVSPGLNMANQIQWPNCPKLDGTPGYEYITAPDPTKPDSYWPQPDTKKYTTNLVGYPNTLLYGPTYGGLKRPIWYSPGLVSDPGNPTANNVWVDWLHLQGRPESG